MYHSQEPKQSGTTNQVPASGFIGNLSLSGVTVIDLNFWAENNTAYIREARLELWRVS
jgi:hypothetical protein